VAPQPLHDLPLTPVHNVIRIEASRRDLPTGNTAQLYAMPSHAAGKYLVDIAEQQGIGGAAIKWYDNVLVIIS
jgi:hypothetical protein